MPRVVIAAIVVVLVAVAAAFLGGGMGGVVGCKPGAWRNEYGCVTPCPPGSGRSLPGSAACVSDLPPETPTPVRIFRPSPTAGPIVRRMD